VHFPRSVSRIESRHVLERFRDPRDNSVECARDLHGYSFSSVGRSSHCKWSLREYELGQALSLFWNRIRKIGFVTKIRKITVSRSFKNVDPAPDAGV